MLPFTQQFQAQSFCQYVGLLQHGHTQEILKSATDGVVEWGERGGTTGSRLNMTFGRAIGFRLRERR